MIRLAGLLIAANIPSIICVSGAVALMLLKINVGWGWLLIVALLLTHTPSKGDGQ